MFFRLIFTCVMLLMGYSTAAAQKDSTAAPLPDSVALVLPKADAIATADARTCRFRRCKKYRRNKIYTYLNSRQKKYILDNRLSILRLLNRRFSSMFVSFFLLLIL